MARPTRARIESEMRKAKRRKVALMTKHRYGKGPVFHPVTLEWMYGVECALAWVLGEDVVAPSRLGTTGLADDIWVVQR